MTVLMLLPWLAAASAAPADVPVIRSNSATVTIRDGAALKKDGWTLAPEVDPDVYEAELIEGRPQTVTFVTDVESISFMVEEGKRYDFVIRLGGRDCRTRIVGSRFTPAAVFDEAFRAAHRGRITVEVPEVSRPAPGRAAAGGARGGAAPGPGTVRAFFRETADVGEMKRWLDRNVPGSSDYGCGPLPRIIDWFERNGPAPDPARR